MNKVSVNLSILFSAPFWIGICEKTEDGLLSVCKITFGAEPGDYEVQNFILDNWYRLSFSPAVEAGKTIKEHMNPKRVSRIVRKQTADIGIGTKSQQALKLQQEQGKFVKKSRSRDEKEAEKERQFFIHQQKKKEKHKGR